MKLVLWELHSRSDMAARCAYERNPPGHIITVTVGDTERFREEHVSEADAHDEAGHLLADFMLNGWTTVMYRDSRIALP